MQLLIQDLYNLTMASSTIIHFANNLKEIQCKICIYIILNVPSLIHCASCMFTQKLKNFVHLCLFLYWLQLEFALIHNKLRALPHPNLACALHWLSFNLAKRLPLWLTEKLHFLVSFGTRQKSEAFKAQQTHETYYVYPNKLATHI